ncbi:MAG: peptidase [Magnetococcales bacterium]|nr:peptidase [Magnetococcales bacterium]
MSVCFRFAAPVMMPTMNTPTDTISIQIFRPGRHTAMNGKTLDFTDTDLLHIAQGYNPEIHEAPVVIGHPATDDPAWGWVKGLSVRDGGLEAALTQVDPAFAQAVRDGRYKKVSASFYPPSAAGNPKPDSWYLRHVGFLGGQPPAVKGLRTIQFGEDADVITVEFIETKPSEGKPMTDPASKEVAAQSDSAALIKLESVLKARETAALAKLEGDLKAHEAQFAEQAKALKAREEQMVAREKAIQVREAEARSRRSAEFAERHTKEGRLLPRETGPVTAILDYLETGGETISFSEGVGSAAQKISKGAATLFQEFVAGLPKRVEFAEIAAGTAEMKAADADTLAEHALVYCEAQRKVGRTVSIADAVTRLAQGGAQ